MQPLIPIMNLDDLRHRFPTERELWAVDIDRQRLYRVKDKGLSSSTPISTSRFGCGNTPDSNCTPLGAHRVCELLGQESKIGQRFISRKPVGVPLSKWTDGKDDAILTRILWLDGMEKGLNENSRTRYIYIHGTNQEQKLGTPASDGCIRIGNKILVDWVEDLNGTKPLVWIGILENPPSANRPN